MCRIPCGVFIHRKADGKFHINIPVNSRGDFEIPFWNTRLSAYEAIEQNITPSKFLLHLLYINITTFMYYILQINNSTVPRFLYKIDNVIITNIYFDLQNKIY